MTDKPTEPDPPNIPPEQLDAALEPYEATKPPKSGKRARGRHRAHHGTVVAVNLHVGVAAAWAVLFLTIGWLAGGAA